MVQAFVGQAGNAVVKMYDAQGRETNSYDTVSGIQYASSAPDVVSVVDHDAEPKDARLMASAVGSAQVTCTFDGDPGDGLRQIQLVSEQIDVVLPPPGAATSAEFTVTFQPVA